MERITCESEERGIRKQSTEEKKKKEQGQNVKKQKGCVKVGPVRLCILCDLPVEPPAVRVRGHRLTQALSSFRVVHSRLSQVTPVQLSQESSLPPFLFLSSDNGTLLRHNGSGHVNDETELQYFTFSPKILKGADNKSRRVQNHLQMIIDNNHANTSGTHISHIWQGP